MHFLLLTLTLTSSTSGPRPESPPQPPVPQPWLSPLPYPVGMVPFEATRTTQWVARVNGADAIRPAASVEVNGGKWVVSGGMQGLTGWRSDKFKLIPPGGVIWVGEVQVKNSFGHFQPNRALRRLYPDGTRFDDVLSYGGRVFEHRSNEKSEGRWQSRVLYRDEVARPPGYSGLRMSCASCHDEAGTGGYAQGLVPGGDFVLSENLPWQLLGYR